MFIPPPSQARSCLSHRKRERGVWTRDPEERSRDEKVFQSTNAPFQDPIAMSAGSGRCSTSATLGWYRGPGRGGKEMRAVDQGNG
jgi:hypothetical protein